MTDQIPADVTPEDMAHARAYAQDVLDAKYIPDRIRAVARVLNALLPRPTLADMTPEERAMCAWMQCDVKACDGQWVIANPFDDDEDVGLIDPTGDICWRSPDLVTPRPDLPRLEWPGDGEVAPAPAPALPDGWRLADHREYGRVIVTSPAPDAYGNVCFVAPVPGFIGNDWHLCDPDELTYIDQEADQ